MITPIIMVFSLSIEYSGVFELGVWLDYEIRFYAFKIVENGVKYMNSRAYMCFCGITESSGFLSWIRSVRITDYIAWKWLIGKVHCLDEHQ